MQTEAWWNEWRIAAYDEASAATDGCRQNTGTRAQRVASAATVRITQFPATFVPAVLGMREQFLVLPAAGQLAVVD